MKEIKQTRFLAYDILRIISAFGVVMLHSWGNWKFPVIIWIPMRTILVFFVSFLMTAVVRRIPFLGKYFC